jgi:hypothetical protein
MMRPDEASIRDEQDLDNGAVLKILVESDFACSAISQAGDAQIRRTAQDGPPVYCEVALRARSEGA